MPTLRNTLTGAVVTCDEATAARLGSQWQSTDASTAGGRTKTRKATARKVGSKAPVKPEPDSGTD